jgi:hypothetical protein
MIQVNVECQEWTSDKLKTLFRFYGNKNAQLRTSNKRKSIL